VDSKNLLTALKEAASELLHKEGLYSVLDYGWEGEDTPSGEYIGLAMWTTAEPITIKYAGDIAYLTAAFLRQREPFQLHQVLERTPWFL
jgi:hypothetical protein